MSTLEDSVRELAQHVTTLEGQLTDSLRRRMGLTIAIDKWRAKADQMEERNRELLEILQAHNQHPGASHTMESLGYQFLWNAERLVCECGHQSMGVTDEAREDAR